MTPDEMTAAWTAIGVGCSLLVGAGGTAIGLVGIRQAKTARKTADSANETAEKAAATAVEANAIAEKSLEVARDANAISREANAIAQREDDRAIELHDVEWDWTWKTHGVAAVRNRGRHAAHSVYIQFTLDDISEKVEPGTVERDTVVPINMTERLGLWSSTAPEDRLFLKAWPPEDPLPPTHHARLKIQWRTPQGAPRTFDKEYPLTELEIDPAGMGPPLGRQNSSETTT